MKDETTLLLRARYDYNRIIIKNKLVGYGNAQLENDLIDMIKLSECNIELRLSGEKKLD